MVSTFGLEFVNSTTHSPYCNVVVPFLHESAHNLINDCLGSFFVVLSCFCFCSFSCALFLRLYSICCKRIIASLQALLQYFLLFVSLFTKNFFPQTGHVLSSSQSWLYLLVCFTKNHPDSSSSLPTALFQQLTDKR